MRRLVFCCSIALLAGCMKPKDEQAPQAAAATPAAPAMPAPIALADVAGKWTVNAMPMGKDSTILTYELSATATNDGWTVTFAGRKPQPMRVTAVAGDSVTVDAGPYESMLRKGVQVTTHGILRLQGGKLVGTTTAHYPTKGADSVLVLRVEGSRAH